MWGHASFVPAPVALASVTPETLLRIGSLSRIFTVTAAWFLIGHGALTLGAPVRTYPPALRLAGGAMAVRFTIVHLERA